MEETRESELKQTKEEYPESLTVVRTRFERDFDSRSGNIVYHHTCYFAGATRSTHD